jgi:hypothetical protein
MSQPEPPDREKVLKQQVLTVASIVTDRKWRKERGEEGTGRGKQK